MLPTRTDEELIELRDEWRKLVTHDHPLHEHLGMSYSDYLRWENRLYRESKR